MSEHEITLTVNGERRELTVEARTLLVDVLRNELGYTGPNVGCESGVCGACTVHLNGDPMKSCTAFAVQADGADIRTIEDVGSTESLHPVQSAFQREHALQCGYCTPGMIMTVMDLLERNPDPTSEEIRSALKGNVCRCTGYQNIVRAVKTAATEYPIDDRADAEAAGGD